MSTKKLSFEWFSKAMTYLAETMAVEMTEIRIASYYEALEEFNQDIMALAFKDCRNKCKYFPQVSEIIDYYNEIYEGLHPVKRIGMYRQLTGMDSETGELIFDGGDNERKTEKKRNYHHLIISGLRKTRRRSKFYLVRV